MFVMVFVVELIKFFFFYSGIVAAVCHMTRAATNDYFDNRLI